MSKDKDYILGTDVAELQRLGLQHQIWASEAQEGWNLAGFNKGMTLLDLGSGPGFCSKELAYIVGDEGKLIAVDQSKNYIEYIDELTKLHHLNIETIHSTFDDLNLEPNSLDGMYCRWALAWLSNPVEVLSKIKDALKPGGKMVIQEYYDWQTHATFPTKPNLKKAIAMCFESFEDGDGNINIGKELTLIAQELDLEIIQTRPMTKLARPQDIAWQWPKSFYEVYFPKIMEMGYLSKQELESALTEMNELEKSPVSTLFCPYMVEVILQKK